MEVDPEEVKRHLKILGYTHVEPNLLNEFVKGTPTIYNSTYTRHVVCDMRKRVKSLQKRHECF